MSQGLGFIISFMSLHKMLVARNVDLITLKLWFFESYYIHKDIMFTYIQIYLYLGEKRLLGQIYFKCSSCCICYMFIALSINT